MLYAQSETGEKILPEKYGRAFCPFCNGVVIAKCGEINYHHWAHQSNKECDEWHESESDWHLKWKSQFPKENVEVTIRKNDKRHRADVVGNEGAVIELQHSSISTIAIREKEVFYKNMLWVFDLANKQHFFKRKEQINEREFSFKWVSPKRSLIACKKPLYFDYGMKKMLCVTKFSYAGYGTGYYVEKNEFILEHGGIPQPAT